MKKDVKVSKSQSVPRGKLEEIKKKPGMSNAGKYKDLPASDFAGPKGTFPIDTKARARNALARAHFSPHPEEIRRKVHAKYPSIGKAKSKQKED